MSGDPTSVQPVRPAGPATAPERPQHAQRVPDGAGFDRLLSERLQAPDRAEGLRWSAHARDRLAQRHIAVTPEVERRLGDAVQAAAAKGGRDSLVMVDELAFVVSVANRTVVTAVESQALSHRVFTNIDSAVLG